MKEKSTKQSKKDKPTVQIKDLKPTKDAKGQVSRQIVGWNRLQNREVPGGIEYNLRATQRR
jgi:hypothetical protein